MNPSERKMEIVVAAIKHFSEHGYHATQISDIIEEADIARGTFYLYFKSKHEIFCSILEDFINHISLQVKPIEINSAETPAEQMRKNVERVVDAVLDKPEIAKILFNEAVGLDSEVDGRLGPFYKRLLDIIGRAIKRGIPLGLVRNVNSEVAACIVLGGVREVFVQRAVFGNINVDRDTIVDGLINVLIGGLGQRSMLA